MQSFSAKKPLTVIVGVILIITLGVMAFSRMPTNLFPEFELPYVVVYTSYAGASPEKVEASVTKPVESALSTIGGIQNISSVSSENVSMVILEFTYGVNMDSTLIEMNNSLDQIKGSFDSGVGSPILMQVDPDMLPVMVVSVDIDGKDITDVSDYARDVVVPALERVNGVASVTGMGLVQEEVRVTLSQAKIDALNNKITQKVDKELADAQQKLDDARRELEEGKKNLNSEARSKRGELNKAQEQIETGIGRLEDAGNQLNAAIREAQQQLKELNDQKAKLEALIAGRQDLPKVEAGILACEAGISALESAVEGADKELSALLFELAALEEELAGIPDTPENQGAREELHKRIDALNEQIARARAAVERLERLLSEANAQLAGLREYKTAIEAGLAALGNPGEEELNALLSRLDEGIALCEATIGELESNKADSQGALDNLSAQLKTIKEGRAALESGLSQAEAQIAGGEKELEGAQAELDEAKDAAFKNAGLEGLVSVAMVSGVLTADNFSMPAGYAYEDGEPFSIKIGERFKSLDEIAGLELFTAEVVGTVTLLDVADGAVKDNAGETYAKVNGNDGVLLSVQKQSSASTTGVSRLLRDAFAGIEAGESGAHITTFMGQGVYIDIIIETVLQNLLMGGALAVLVLLIFLKNFRPTFIVALSIPISVLLSVVLMYFTGVSLNIISLAGLALGVGMLVDNSIVAIENIYRLRAEGVGPVRAAVEGAKEISGAIVASTLTTVCVFLPIVFTEGIAKELFVDMGLTIAYSLISSLFVAMTVVPALSSTMLRKNKHREAKFFTRVQNAYARALTVSLKHKWISLSLALVLLAGSVFAVSGMGLAFMPETDSQQLMISVSMPEEATDERIRELADEAQARIARVEGVATVGAMQGGMMGGGDSVSMYVVLSDERAEKSAQIERKILSAVQDMPISLAVSSGNMDISALGGSGIQVGIYGGDLEVLRELAAELAGRLASVNGIAEVSDGMEDNGRETLFAVDKNKAMSYGLTVAQVYQAVAQALSYRAQVSDVMLDGGEYPLVVELEEDARQTRETLRDLTLSGTRDGEPVDVRLGDIAVVSEADMLSSIRRENLVRCITISAAIGMDDNVGLVGRDVEKALADFELPDGYTLEMSGENETINDTLSDLIQMALLAVFLIYLIMVAQFQSLLSPFIVMFTIPLAFTGGALLLFACGMEISVIACLGLLVLVGVVVNNGIVFVDCANRLYAGGMSRRDALVETGRRRMRPILMTAVTTILGLVTLALGVGTGADMLQPMAVVIIGGLTYATLLTMFIVPALYDILCRKPPRVVDVQKG